jgi:peroxin-12
MAKEGIPLPPDRSLCALCLQKRANPSVVTVSGFVFCYSCVFKYVSKVSSPNHYSLFPNPNLGISLYPSSMVITQYKRCPVTLIPASVDQIRRLFQDT